MQRYNVHEISPCSEVLSYIETGPLSSLTFYIYSFLRLLTGKCLCCTHVGLPGLLEFTCL